MIKPLAHWVLTDKQHAFYDSESATAIEMVARLYAVIQDLIKDHNISADQIKEAIEYMTNNIDQTAENVINGLIQEGRILVGINYNASEEALNISVVNPTNEEPI